MASTYSLSPDTFTRDFASISKLILEEWPELSAEELSQTEGEVDEVVRFVAERTDHSRTLVRAHLAEIQHVQGAETGSVEQLLSRVEGRLEQLSGTLREELVPQVKDRAEQLRGDAVAQAERAKERAAEAREAVEEKARENILTSLLIALGFGFLMGLLLGNRGR